MASPPPPTQEASDVVAVCAAALQQAVQVVLHALLVVGVGGRAVFVVVALQHGDHVVVAKVHRFVHRRVPPSVGKKTEGGAYGRSKKNKNKNMATAYAKKRDTSPPRCHCSRYLKPKSTSGSHF